MFSILVYRMRLLALNTNVSKPYAEKEHVTGHVRSMYAVLKRAKVICFQKNVTAVCGQHYRKLEI
jgi:hypothetical protein